MSITVNSRIVAETKIQGFTIRPIVGAYEFLFSLDVTINPQTDYARRVSIIGARVNLRTDGSGQQPLGFARPETSFEIQQGPHPYRVTPALVLPLHPVQLAVIERLRNAGDVSFELLASGVGIDQHREQPMQDELRIQVPRSEGVAKMLSASARDGLLLGIPFPLFQSSKRRGRTINE